MESTNAKIIKDKKEADEGKEGWVKIVRWQTTKLKAMSKERTWFEILRWG